MLTGSRAVHRTDVGAFALFNVFASPKVNPPVGHVYGFYLPGYEPFTLDLTYQKVVGGGFMAPIILVNGDIGGGKTTLVTKAALNEREIRQRNGEPFRLFVQIVRSNDGVLELSELCKTFGVTPEDMSQQTINLYDQSMGLSAPEQLALLVDAMEFVTNERVDSEHVIVMMAALRSFIAKCQRDKNYRKHASDKLFFQELVNLRAHDVERSIAMGKLWEPEEVPSSITPLDQEVGETELLGGSPSVGQFSGYEFDPSTIGLRDDRVKEVANNCLMILSRLSDADFGEIFSGEGSMSQLLSREVVALNLTGLNERTMGFLQQVIWRYKMSAVARNDRRFIFSMEIHDEIHKLWRILPYATNMANYLKVIRSTGTYMWIVSHRFPGDYEALPPETRDLALNSLLEADIVFHGKQSEESAENGRKFFHYSRVVKNWIAAQEQGEFVFVMGRQEPTRVLIHLTQDERQITESEFAASSKIDVTPEVLALRP